MNAIRYLLLLFYITLIFNITYSAEYKIPRAAYSVYAEDLDLDGDKDIVVGHNYNGQTEWSGVSILLNTGKGIFALNDSVFLYAGQPDIQAKNLNTDPYHEIIAKYYDTDNETEYIAIINNFSLENINYFSLHTNKGVGDITTGDVDNDADIDIIIASNKGKFWGVLYNDCTGNFSAPQYHYVTDSYPTDIACGNLNDDGRDDIVVSGQYVEIYFSYESGFECYILGDHELSVKIADIDNDGDNDVIGLTNLYLIGYTGITIYENIGSNNFTEHDQILFQPPLSHLEISDVNNDSLPDVVCTAYEGIYILNNKGGYKLSEPQFYPNTIGENGRVSYCADLDNNGWNDIITLIFHYSTMPSYLNIFFNDGTGQFIENPPTGVNENNKSPIPSEYHLTNYPNPFNNSTNIQFVLAKVQEVNLSICNIKGVLIRNLIDNKEFINGSHSIYWDGKNKRGKEVSSGVYLYTLRVDERIYTRKMLLVK